MLTDRGSLAAMSRFVALSLLLSLGLVASCGSPGGGESDGSSEAGGSSDESTSGATPTTGDGTEEGSSTGPACACADEEACVAGTCVDVGRADVARGCNVLGDPAGRGQCLYPWPADVLLPADPASETGLRLQYDPALLPVNDAGQAFAADEITAGFDGFSPLSQIRFAFARPVDGEGLAPIDDIGRSLADDATIVVVDADSGERWPYFAELDATAEAGEPVTVFVRPMRRLRPGARYVVGIRGLTSGGEAIAAAPLFAALRDGQTTDVPELEAIRAGQEEVFAALTAAGVERSSLQLAWGFTTASQTLLRRDFLAIAPQVEAAAGSGDLGYAIDEVEESPDPALKRVVRGTFTVPSCLTGNSGPGEVIRRDAMGLPDCSGTTEARFVLAIPQALADAGAPAPLTIYGHGLLGSGEEAVGIARRATAGIVVGTDFWGLSEDDLPAVAEMLAANLDGGRTMPDRLLQSVVNFTTLAHLARTALVADPLVFENETSLIDPEAIHYLGGSQGGIMGATVMAMAEPLRRGVLVVGGANYSLMIWRSTAFSLLGEIWEGSHADPQEREFLFALFQSSMDLSDPLTYTDLIAEPLGGGAAKRILLVESMGDAQVPNIATEAMARTYGLQMLGPAVAPVFGVADAPGPLAEGSALLQIDTGLGPVPPGVNLPLGEDNGAHGAAVDDPSAIAMIEQFLFTGVMENLCDGPCDPG